MSDNREWHLDRKVPLGILGFLFLQTAALFYWGGQISERVQNNEKALAMQSTVPVDIATMSTRQEVLLEETRLLSNEVRLLTARLDLMANELRALEQRVSDDE